MAKDCGDGLRLFGAVNAGLDDRGALNVSSPWCEFFQTNDAASIDEGRLTLQGRIDRIVKLNDKRVSLEGIEAKLLESGLLADCYCAPHPKFKRIAALLELNGEGLKKFRKIGKKGVVAELKELLKLEFKNSVRYFKIVEKMPRNQQGKFEKSEFENALFASPKPVWSGGVVNEAGEICGGQICQNGQNLESALSCGANSSCVKFDENGERLDGAQKYEFSAIMHAGLEIFESHFPNLPLLPGFMQLDYVFELASMVGIDVSGASTVENLKFMKFVRPGDLLRICFEKRGGKLYFELFCNGEKCSTGRVTL